MTDNNKKIQIKKEALKRLEKELSFYKEEVEKQKKRIEVLNPNTDSAVRNKQHEILNENTKMVVICSKMIEEKRQELLFLE